ncbi:hypothetical protein ABZ468_47345 [Streptomyces sp. NPDC005708]|uniref:hypothetical protein n=1 Tax=Streptomyces sp. NPDC005708 TaxID=3154564 RepID=UPI0033EEDC9F
MVRIDGGSDFLSKTVTSAFAALVVPVQRVRHAHLKGGQQSDDGNQRAGEKSESKDRHDKSPCSAIR